VLRSGKGHPRDVLWGELCRGESSGKVTRKELRDRKELTLSTSKGSKGHLTFFTLTDEERGTGARATAMGGGKHSLKQFKYYIDIPGEGGH